MKILKILLFASASLGALHAQNSPEDAPQSEIIALERQPDGFDLFFTGDPNQLYAVYVSSGDDNWEYLTMGANIEGDMFHVHDDKAGESKKRLYRVVVLNQDCQQVRQTTASDLMFWVQYTDFLTEAHRAVLWQAAVDYHRSMNGVKAAEAAVKQAQRELAEYLKEVSAARFAWIEAQHATDAAMKAKKAEERRLADKKKALEGQKKEQEHANKMRDQQIHEKGVFLKWAKMYDEAGDTRKADEMRANAEAAQERIDFWDDEVDYQDDAVEGLEQDITDSESALGDHDANITDKTDEEKAAKEAYDDKKAGKAPKEGKVADAKKGLEEAEAAKEAARKRWIDEARKAKEDGKKEADRQAAAAHAASEAGQAGEPAPKPVAPKPSDRAIQVAKFLEHIKKYGGRDKYNDALKAMFGTALSAGTVTLEGLGAAMAQWATGKGATGPAVGTALASGLISFGYGIVAGWVQDAASKAIKGIATRRMVDIYAVDSPKSGDAKFYQGSKKKGQESNAELFIRNADGTATIFVYRPSQGLIVKNIKLAPGR
ncbi:hypothetical protein N9A94_09015 [Akkermansiaceae bacterium]|nr:hypothetical protein [Akkermansiaceae bacterium]MDA7888162.1 hypothetical protein [Akkermansiaceae bacterium]MDB4537959.1 hypothetical protein [Akkermansiaceae bacterium]